MKILQDAACCQVMWRSAGLAEFGWQLTAALGTEERAQGGGSPWGGCGGGGVCVCVCGCGCVCVVVVWGVCVCVGALAEDPLPPIHMALDSSEGAGVIKEVEQQA